MLGCEGKLPLPRGGERRAGPSPRASRERYLPRAAGTLGKLAAFLRPIISSSFFFKFDYISISSTLEENKIDQDRTGTICRHAAGHLFEEPLLQTIHNFLHATGQQA